MIVFDQENKFVKTISRCKIVDASFMFLIIRGEEGRGSTMVGGIVGTS